MLDKYILAFQLFLDISCEQKQSHLEHKDTGGFHFSNQRLLLKEVIWKGKKSQLMLRSFVRPFSCVALFKASSKYLSCCWAKNEVFSLNGQRCRCCFCTITITVIIIITTIMLYLSQWLFKFFKALKKSWHPKLVHLCTEYWFHFSIVTLYHRGCGHPVFGCRLFNRDCVQKTHWYAARIDCSRQRQITVSSRWRICFFILPSSTRRRTLTLWSLNHPGTSTLQP